VIRLRMQGVAACLVWWWTTRMLLFGRIGWVRLVPSALLTGSCIVLYSWGSNLVMPAYVAASATQFGGLGLILAITTWLVGAAGILVAAAVVGRVLVEDEDIARLARRVVDWLERRRGRDRSGRGSG
jgi:membrane protein